MKKFLMSIVVLLLAGCLGTGEEVAAQRSNLLVRAAQAEAREHSIAASVSVIKKPRWGYSGQHLDSVERMLSQHLGILVWCYREQKRGIEVARCTSKRHLDSVSSRENTVFTYSYYPGARRAGISKPVFLDECYRCGRYRSYDRHYRRW